MRDLFNNVALRRAMSPVAAGTDNTAYVSQIIDMQGWRSLLWAILIGTNTDADATFTVLVEEGDAANLSDAAAVDDKDLLGTEAGASFTFTHDDSVRKIGYKGRKRYCRLTITPAGNNSGNIFIASAAILGHPAAAPEDTTDQ